MDDEWQLRWVRVPDGTHLSNSRETRGASRDLLREDGTNRNLGPTESLPADQEMLHNSSPHVRVSPDGSGEQWPTRGQEFVAGLVIELVRAVDWDAVFKEFVAPALKRRTERIGRRVRSAVRRSNEPAPSVSETTAQVAVVGTEPEDTEAVVVADRSASVPMSAAEFRERAIAALAAEAYAAQQKQILASARIVDDDIPAELEGAMRLLLSGQVASLGDAQIQAVMEFLEGVGAEGMPAITGGQAQSLGLAATSEEQIK